METPPTPPHPTPPIPTHPAWTQQQQIHKPPEVTPGNRAKPGESLGGLGRRAKLVSQGPSARSCVSLGGGGRTQDREAGERSLLLRAGRTAREDAMTGALV